MAIDLEQRRHRRVRCIRLLGFNHVPGQIVLQTALGPSCWCLARPGGVRFRASAHPGGKTDAANAGQPFQKDRREEIRNPSSNDRRRRLNDYSSSTVFSFPTKWKQPEALRETSLDNSSIVLRPLERYMDGWSRPAAQAGWLSEISVFWRFYRQNAWRPTELPATTVHIRTSL